MFEAAILGTVQGLAEWLPVSSEGMIFLVKSNFFPSQDGIVDIIKLALFLHLGTFLAALIYFRKDVWKLLKTLFNYRKAEPQNKKVLIFLVISTFISGILGLLFIKGMENVNTNIESASRYINLIVAGLLIVTAVLQIKIRKKEFGRTEDSLKKQDGVFLGIAQGMAALPGLSRSGLTVSALLISEFKDNVALRLSFLMSLPIVLLGNVVLNLENFSFSVFNLVALLFSFIFGFITIDFMLKLAKKMNFGYFVLGFAFLMIIFAFI